ncbi:hypothetical protein V2J09_022129 [Rumex salicifolius]
MRRTEEEEKVVRLNAQITLCSLHDNMVRAPNLQWSSSFSVHRKACTWTNMQNSTNAATSYPLEGPSFFLSPRLDFGI